MAVTYGRAQILKPFNHLDGHHLMADTTTRPASLELRGVAKSFGAVRALSSGSLRVEPGSIHALVGENGAGKATAVKGGGRVFRRGGGEFLLEGASVDFG